MDCPVCLNDKSRVIRTGENFTNNQKKRVRLCTKCGSIYYTAELIKAVSTKANNKMKIISIEEYERQKTADENS